MPYYKRKRLQYRRKRPQYRRKANGGSGYLATAGKALAVAYSVKKLLNVEKKFVDNSLQTTLGHDAPVIQLLNGVAQGDGDQTRDGNSIKMLYAQVHGQMTNLTASDRTVRIMVVQQRDTNGTAPVISDILADSASAYTPLSFFQRNTIHKFNVLYDKRISLTDVASDKALRQFNINIPFNGDHSSKVRFDNSGATIADISKNSVYLIVTSDNVVASLPPTLTMRSRVTFLDN